VAAYGAAILQDLGLADSSFWSESAFRVSRFPDILAASGLVFNHCAVLRLSAQSAQGPAVQPETRPNCAQRVIDGNRKEDRIALGEALIRESEMELAFQQIDYVIVRFPDFGPARTALGRWYAELGDSENARVEWLRGGQLGEVEALVLLGDSYLPGEVPEKVADALRGELRTATSQVQFHLTGILYYRFKFFRESPFAILLPGAWRGVVPGRYSRAIDALERWESAG